MSKPRYRTVSVEERLPPEGVYVPTIDSEDQIIIYCYYESTNSWYLREMTKNGINNNLPILYWLEKIETIKLLKDE